MRTRLLMAAGLAFACFLVSGPLVCAQQYRVVRAQLGPPGEPVQAGQYSLRDLISLSLAKNPALQQAGLTIQAAQGKAVQAGLYPNPTVGVSGDELGDRTGPGGIWTAQVGQEIVLGGKLKLSRAVAQKEVDQATLALQNQRYALFTTVRQGYFEVLTGQRRVELLDELVKLAQKAQDSAESLQKAKQIAELDVLPFRVELDRLTADFEASQRELIAARRRLAAVIGQPNLPIATVVGSLEQLLPSYKYEEIHYLVMEAHPEVQFAVVGINRAELALRRAQVEKIPNVTLGSGYVRQNQNRSSDWLIGVSVPVPVFNPDFRRA
jgi:cobalt-zinc-cadmium efflux system outer membrane protein